MLCAIGDAEQVDERNLAFKHDVLIVSVYLFPWLCNIHERHRVGGKAFLVREGDGSLAKTTSLCCSQAYHHAHRLVTSLR